MPSISQTIPITAKVHTTICIHCKNQSRGYYDAIIQIRGGNRRFKPNELESILDFIYKQLKFIPKAYIAKVKPVRGGADLEVATKYMARLITNQVAKHYYAKVTITSKAITYKEGHPVSRLIFAIIFPFYRVGDYAYTTQGLFEITLIDRNGPHGLHLQTNISQRLKDLKEKDILSISSYTGSWILMSKSPDTAQLMDLKTYSTVDISLFPRLAEVPEGATIELAFLDDTYYLIQENESSST